MFKSEDGDFSRILLLVFALRPDGRECPLLVVEGSGWRGRRESDSLVFCHPNLMHSCAAAWTNTSSSQASSEPPQPHTHHTTNTHTTTTTTTTTSNTHHHQQHQHTQPAHTTNTHTTQHNTHDTHTHTHTPQVLFKVTSSREVVAQCSWPKRETFVADGCRRRRRRRHRQCPPPEAATPPCLPQVCTDERRNGPCRESAPQRTAPEDGKCPGAGT